jgi:hypothetical protein
MHDFKTLIRVATCKRATATVLAAAFLFIVLADIADAAIIYQTGPLGDEIARLEGLVFPENSGLYVAPNASQRTAFRALAASVMNGSYATATTQAEALGYELVDFYDTETSHRYYLLREHLNAQGKQNFGWGNYIWDPAPLSDVLVEAPHPLYDNKTPEFAIDVFQGIIGRGFLMAGAHRNQDGSITGIANVATQSNSIFEAVHETWMSATTLPMQIHGFDYDNHENFPAGTDIVLSNGDGAVHQPHIDIDQAFEAAGFQSYVFNYLPSNSPVNVLVNDGVSGGTFSSLGATGNVQGQYTRNTYGTPFVHCEIEQSIRLDDPNNWQPGVNALVSALRAPVPVPEPATILFSAIGIIACAGIGLRRFSSAA